MSTSAVGSATTSYYTSLTNAASSDQVDNPDGELTKTDFLSMLITKLKYQDPTDPVDDSEFTSELVQYASLEEMQNLNDTMDTVSTSMDDLNTNVESENSQTNTGQAISTIGKTVTIQVTDSLGNVTGTVTGTVDSVKFEDGAAKLVVNGTSYDMADVTEVSS